MQARYTSLLLSTWLAGTAVAQVTLEYAHEGPGAGRVDQVITAAGYVAPPAGGADVTFDLSTLLGSGAKTYQWLAPNALPNGDLFPGATVALTDGGADTIYYQANTSGITRVGEHTVLMGLYPVDAPYTDGPIELPFPVTYGDTWTDAISSTFPTDGTHNAVRTGTITGNADGYGTFILPGGGEIGGVLRVRTYVNESIAITSPVPTTITHHRHVDAYYVPFAKYPLFRSFADSLSTPLGINQYTSGTEWLAEASLGVREAAPVATDLRLAPNPTDDAVELTWEGDGGRASIEVFDATGATVLTRDLGVRTNGIQRARIDAGAWRPGLYLVRLRDAGHTVVKRLTVR